MAKKVWLCAATMAFTFVTGMVASHALAAYPESPIEIVVHSGPGGGSDLFARQISNILEREGIVKQKVQVANRTGGGATMAVNYIAGKKGDAYVFMSTTTGPLTTVLRGSTRLKFEELVPIAMLAEDPNLAFTGYNSPFKNMKDVIAAAKKAPRKINIAIGTIGGSEHICAHRVAKAAGVEFNIVAFKGGGEAAAALLGGHVDMSFGNVQEQIGQIEAKKIRPLATMTEKRLPFMPDVPTMKEEGYDAVYTQFRGFWAAPGFPDYAVKYWEDVFEKLMKVQAFKDYLKSNQAVESFRKHDEFKKYITTYATVLQKDVDTIEIYRDKK
jgi:putative tricarboxylic transport membrane protein